MERERIEARRHGERRQHRVCMQRAGADVYSRDLKGLYIGPWGCELTPWVLHTLGMLRILRAPAGRAKSNGNMRKGEEIRRGEATQRCKEEEMRKQNVKAMETKVKVHHSPSQK